MICGMRTSAFRHLPLFHYTQSTVETQTYARFKHAVLDASFIEQKLGIPPRPKRPIVPFFRYMIEIRPSVVAKHPTLAGRDHVKLISKMWHSLDEKEKEKYNESFAKDNAVYKELLVEYNKSANEDDKQKFKEKRMELKDEVEKRKYIRSQRRKAIAFDRPKLPSPGFFRFLEDHDNRQLNETYGDYLRRKSSEWKSLNDNQREPYKVAAEDVQKYKVDLLKWKGKMIKSGNFNLLRSEMPVFTKFENILSSKKS